MNSVLRAMEAWIDAKIRLSKLDYGVNNVRHLQIDVARAQVSLARKELEKELVAYESRGKKGVDTGATLGDIPSS